MKTLFTTKLGVQFPIMQGGLQAVALPKLAAAVSEAGGLGTINALFGESHFRTQPYLEELCYARVVEGWYPNYPITYQAPICCQFDCPSCHFSSTIREVC